MGLSSISDVVFNADTDREKMCIRDREKEYPAIVNDPKIVWTLYNTGYLGKNGPHSKPKGGALSDYAMKSYEEMGCLLE